MFHLMRLCKSVWASYKPFPIHQRCLSLSAKFFLIFSQRRAQTDRVATGSLLALFLADVSIWREMSLRQQHLPFSLVSILYLQVVRSKNTTINFLDYLSSYHSNIKFTIKFEENNETPFLYILIKRHNDVFWTTVFSLFGLVYSSEIQLNSNS